MTRHGLCASCKALRELVHYDEPTMRGYCTDCVGSLPIPPEVRALMFLAATVPFKVGDRVQVRLAGQLLEGTGTVQEVSFDLEHGGTPVYPTFRVRMEDKAYDTVPDEEWATENCLQLVEEPS